MNPLISFLITYRTPTLKSGANYSDIKTLFDNMEEIFGQEDIDKIEFLIRIDNDDEAAISDCKKVKKRKFNVRVFQHDKWEGRWCFNYHQMYLFSQVNKNTKFIGILTDDCTLDVGKGKNLIKELEQYKDEPYVIFWGSPHIQKDYIFEHDFIDRYNKVVNYRNNTALWTTSFMVYGYPITSRKIYECMGNAGWVLNVDVHFGLLILTLFHNHKIHLTRVLQNFVICRKDNDRIAKKEKNTFNKITRIADIVPPKDAYFFDLTEQQAKNIYLNIKEDNLLDRYLVKEI